MTRRRIVFMGSPAFAIPTLDRLADDHDVLAVYTQPPRRAGRGMRETPQPVAAHAATRGLTVRHPESLKTDEEAAALAALEADVFIVVAYGLILPSPALAIPRFGCINGHASLLPRWRGAAPIQRAIAAGDTTTGVCAMVMEAGLDTGLVLARRECAISNTDTAASLHDRLASLTAELLGEVVAGLPGILDRQQPQDHAAAIYAPKLTPAEAEIDWSLPALIIDRQIRAFTPVPGAWFIGPKGRIRVRAARRGDKTSAAKPGHFLGLDPAGGMRIGTGGGEVILDELQPAGGKPMSARAFLNGNPVAVGSALGATDK
jgi:methionyl-tRNA formyltransferase